MGAGKDNKGGKMKLATLLRTRAMRGGLLAVATVVGLAGLGATSVSAAPIDVTPETIQDNIKDGAELNLTAGPYGKLDLTGVEGVTLTGAKDYGTTVSSILIKDSSKVSINDIKFEGQADKAIEMNGSVADITINHNEFIGKYSRTVAGTSESSTKYNGKIQITGNNFGKSSSSHDIHIMSNGGDGNVAVTGNTFANIVQIRGIRNNPLVSAEIKHNTWTDAATNAIMVAFDKDVVIDDNTISQINSTERLGAIVIAGGNQKVAITNNMITGIFNHGIGVIVDSDPAHGTGIESTDYNAGVSIVGNTVDVDVASFVLFKGGIASDDQVYVSDDNKFAEKTVNQMSDDAITNVNPNPEPTPEPEPEPSNPTDDNKADTVEPEVTQPREEVTDNEAISAPNTGVASVSASSAGLPVVMSLTSLVMLAGLRLVSAKE